MKNRAGHPPLIRCAGLLLITVLLSSCIILTEKAGRVLDGSVFDEKVLERYGAEDRELKRGFFNGTEGLALTLKDWPTLTFYFAESPAFVESPGGAPETANKVYPHSCRFFCAGVTGWNEFTVDLAGNGTFTPDNSRYVLELENIEILDISSGKIRDGDLRMTGREAVSVLRHRRERLEVLAQWMRAEAESRHAPDFPDLESFEKYWKPLLLPEVVPRKKRPPDYPLKGAPGSEEIQWNSAEDIRWNMTYTAAHFPAELGALRDQGAFLRDWEEALLWLYLVYEWDNIVQRIAENTFVKTR
jgi:hypothetical protein